MFVPPTYHAKTLNFTDEQLDSPTQKCLCDKPVRLRDCMVIWTHKVDDDDFHWFAACHGQCIAAHITMGAA